MDIGLGGRRGDDNRHGSESMDRAAAHQLWKFLQMGLKRHAVIDEDYQKQQCYKKRRTASETYLSHNRHC